MAIVAVHAAENEPPKVLKKTIKFKSRQQDALAAVALDAAQRDGGAIHEEHLEIPHHQL